MSKKLSDFFCDPHTAIKNTALLFLMIFLMIYAFFQIYPTFSSKIKTETALIVSVSDTCTADAYIFRDEEVIPGDGGVQVTLVGDGERVSKGQCFANVYSSKDMASLEEQINSIDRKTEVLEKSVVETNAYVTDISKTEDSITDSMDRMFKNVSDGVLENMVVTEKKLLVDMNKRDLIINMTASYRDEISSLKAERQNIESRINAVSRGLYASSSGSYYGDVDGYENIFAVSALDGINVDSFEEIISKQADDSIIDNNYGKIVKDFVWYTVCETDIMSAAAYSAGSYYSVKFSSLPDEEVKLELINVVKDSSKSKAVLVFRCNTAPEDFTYKRSQQLHIINNRISGYAVPKEALRIVDGKRGVYVLDGDIVRFRLVSIIYENDDYYIVDANPLLVEDENKENAEVFDTSDSSDSSGKSGYVSPEKQSNDSASYKYISLYDSIIVRGKALFDGKTVG